MIRKSVVLKLVVVAAVLAGVLVFPPPEPAYAMAPCIDACPLQRPTVCNWFCQCAALAGQVVTCNQCPDNDYVCGVPVP
jgi:hypothetical protein